jgi:hypothetical protein
VLLFAQYIKDEGPEADASEVCDGHRDQQPAQDLQAPHEREPVADLVDDVAHREWRHLSRGDLEDRWHPIEEGKGREEGERRDPHRAHVPDGGDGEPSERRPDDARRPVRREEDRVGVRQLVLFHQRGHDAEVRGHAPQDLDRAEQEADDVQELDGEHAADGGERDRNGQGDPRDVAGDEEPALVHSVDEGSGGRAKEDVRERLDDAQDRGGGDRVGQVEDQEWQCQTRDLIRDGAEADGRGEQSEPFMTERPFAHGAASIKASARPGTALASAFSDLVSCRGGSPMGQVNVNPGSSDSGFGAGMIIGIILLILIVLVLIFYAGPQIFGGGTTPRSLIDSLNTAVLA